MCSQAPLLCWTHPHGSPVSLIQAGLTITPEDGIHWHIWGHDPWQPRTHPRCGVSSFWQTPVFPKRASQTPAGPAPFAGLGARRRLEVRWLPEAGEPWPARRREWGTGDPRRCFPDQDGPSGWGQFHKVRGFLGQDLSPHPGQNLFYFFICKNIYNIVCAMLSILSVRFMAFTTFTMSCNHHHDFQNFPWPQTETGTIEE